MEINIYTAIGKNSIKLPREICLPPNDPTALIAAIVPNLQENYDTEVYLEGRVILTTKYDLVEKVNATMT